RPSWTAEGRLEASPTIISEKKIPIERTAAAFWNVALMPAPAPRWSAGRLFMIAARFGEENRPMARPVSRSRGGKPTEEKATGRIWGGGKLGAAAITPPVANGRAP